MMVKKAVLLFYTQNKETFAKYFLIPEWFHHVIGEGISENWNYIMDSKPVHTHEYFIHEINYNLSGNRKY